ncbi:MAG: NfeD family protein [Bacteriovoracia bacterium]
MREKILLQILVFVLSLLPCKAFCATLNITEVSLLSVNSAITPATFDYLQQNFKELPDSSLIVLKLNTPGGLVTTTKDIITMVGQQKRPFIVWISPEGASASSAGAIIASAAHFIFMSPGTNMGAATPIGLQGDIEQGDARKKALSDLTALVRSLSELRGRPAEPFEKMITGAESYTDKEALKLKIIEGIVSDHSDILEFVDGKTINLNGIPTTLNVKNVAFKTYEPTLGQKILEVLANPSTAYLLFLVGIALIYFEFQAPGGFISGAIGVCFLILAAISFQVLPLDWGSMGLILAGIVLLILEVFIVSYGILSIAGLIAFVMGSLFLFHGEKGFISIEYPLIMSSIAGVVVAVGLVTVYLIRDRKKQSLNENFFLPVGAKGTVLAKYSPKEYQVKVRGEIWRAFSDQDLELNDHVEVSSVDPKDLFINVKKDLS